MKRFQALMPIYVNGKFEIPDFAQTLALEVAPAAGSTKGIVNNGVLRTTAHAMIPPVAGVAAAPASTGSPAVVGVTAIAQVPEVTGIAATANLAKLKQLTWLLANNPKVYFDAKKYYLERKEVNSNGKAPIRLEVLDNYLKNLLIDHGFDFIKED